jgi:hypothetical protein
MGTHPSGPATIAGTSTTLSAWLKKHPEALGEPVARRFGADLPYLFKVRRVGWGWGVGVGVGAGGWGWGGAGGGLGLGGGGGGGGWGVGVGGGGWGWGVGVGVGSGA